VYLFVVTHAPTRAQLDPKSKAGCICELNALLAEQLINQTEYDEQKAVIIAVCVYVSVWALVCVGVQQIFKPATQPPQGRFE